MIKLINTNNINLKKKKRERTNKTGTNNEYMGEKLEEEYNTNLQSASLVSITAHVARI